MTRKLPSAARIPFLVLSLALFLASAPGAAPTAPPDSRNPVVLRQQAIHISYNEGDFDKVIAEIDVFTKANRTYSRADSVFIAKHLAVVYTANPNTREKGKYYMYRLLELVPSAELVDMFVSDEIDRIFDKVRKEFLARQKSFGVDSTQMSIPGKPARREEPAAAASRTGNGNQTSPAHQDAPKPAGAGTPFYKKTGFWMMTGAGVAAVGAVVTYIHTQEESEGRSIPIGTE